MSGTPDWPHVSRLELPAGARAPLADAGQAVLVYVVDGALGTGHPVAALRRALRGEFVLFPGGEAAVAVNASRRDALALVAIGGLPAAEIDAPLARYFSEDDKAGRLCLAASPDGARGTLALGAPLSVYATRLAARDTIVFEPQSQNAVAFLLSGQALADRTALEPGRLQRIKQGDAVRLSTDTAAHLLVIDFLDDQL